MRNNQKIAHCFYKHYQGEYEMNCDMCKVIEEIKKMKIRGLLRSLKRVMLFSVGINIFTVM